MMTQLDWLIVGGTFIALFLVAVVCQRLIKSVADFLVAGRSAGRYMLTIGGGMVWIGAINIIAMFELYHGAGLVAMWWGLLVTPAAIYLAISGFGVYRFRQTRALTIAQFLEMRYNRTVRVMAGVIAWTVGMLSFGIFPAIGARFFINFCGLPDAFVLMGMTWSTFPVTMLVLLGASLVFVFMGGHMTVLVTDFLQGVFANVTGLLIILVLAVGVLSWPQVVESLTLSNNRRTVSTAAESLANAGLALAREDDDGSALSHDLNRAGSSMTMAGSLLQSLSNTRPNVLATRELVGRVWRQSAHPDAAQAIWREIGEQLARDCENTPHAEAGDAVRDIIYIALREAVDGRISAEEAADLARRYPHDPEDLRFMASLLLRDAAITLRNVEPAWQPSMDLLIQAASELPGTEYPLTAAAQMDAAGQALSGASPTGAMGELATALSSTARTIERRSTSMLDPVSTAGVADFNIWYFIIAIVGMWWAVMSNMQGQAYFASARTAHEMRMGNVLGQWRWLGMCLLFMMLVLATFVYTEHPDYAEQGAWISASLDGIAERAGGASSNAEVQTAATVRNQQFVPVAMRMFLPAGLMGLFCALVLAALISTEDSFLHCWGSVFVQDVVMPFRKKPMGPREHIWWLRIAILIVAAIAFVFSYVYPQQQSILMFFAMVNSIWLAPSGAVLLGGLYWKRGAAPAAVATLIVGVSFGLMGVIAIQGWPVWYQKAFPLNSQWLFFINMAISASVYIGISLMTRKATNLDQTLHRGRYTVESDQTHVDRPTTFFMKCFGITREFTRGDRITAYLIVGWFLAMFVVFMVGTGIGLFVDIGENAWAGFWLVYLGLLLVITVVTTIWFTVGGLINMASLFKIMGDASRDYTDDGRVLHGEEPAIETPGKREET